ncbi:MAG TPA: histidinol dehydrogenase [Gemmatimonadales bacterium]|nr:histidinol dehydrogenase [Gemmatimonadales bacterium]
MIRQISVPPLDSLTPYLPKPSSVDRETRELVGRILADVGERGDAAVREWTSRLDGLDLDRSGWEIPREDWDNALDRIDFELREALETAVERVATFHKRQRDIGFTLLQEDGSLLGMRVNPLDRVGVYVPGGKAAYPSTVIMNVVPASIAGVEEIIAVTPPGGITDAVLAACSLAGVTRLFRIGGAQAIAALALGTRTIPRVDKVVGPGNKWVTEAKRQITGLVGVDMMAGPTEVLIIADSTADVAHVAADMIAQAEHDEDATAWCVTTDRRLADQLPAALEACLSRNPRAQVAGESLRRHGLVIWVPSMRDAIEVANLRAAEHVQIIARDGEGIAQNVRHAGAIFLGPDTPEPVGDYLAGPSHVLPTGGTARFASPLGVYDFVKRTSMILYTRDRLNEDGSRIMALARAEGLYGHAEAVRIRVEDAGRQ